MESEQIVLGSILLNNDLYYDVASTITAEWEFTDSRHRAIYNAIQAMIDDGESADILTISDYLQKNERIENAGGSAYISSLTDYNGSIKYHLKKVHDDAVRSVAKKELGKALTKLSDDMSDSDEIIEDVERAILSIAEHKSGNYRAVSDLIYDEVNRIEERFNSGGELKGIESGIENIDRYVAGFKNGDLVILAARPSIGKTALAFSMARNIAYKYPVGFFSLEMSEDTLMDRFIAMESRISLEAINTGMLARKHFDKLTNGATKIHDESKMFIFDTPNADLNDIRGQARKMVKHEGVKIIFIDYVSLISVRGKFENRTQTVSYIIKQIKQLARELNVPIILLAQVNRKAEGEMPTLSELKESGSLEEDSDLVLILHRERHAEGTIYKANCEIAKHRNGSIGSAELNFIPMFTLFENGEKNEYNK